ncbi:helix-turn-helix domain-containing protein [Paenibacillus sp. J2TS4]|uniref:helix-turn-helix domain-containing protein n=1 Tax=Paenibacillus sp. J2TS4 TaxID=2807194 RepID=UPI001B26E4F8|nr:helix-turn-helix transcriptional regulator [Paenibacillus sp. J2TS4]GIP35071.1 transcriptional regulator [Paenibacillus sp. J2TS4]
MNEDEKKLMGQRIKAKREECRMSQEKLAEMLGMKRTNVANYESGRVIPPGNVLKNLAEIMNTTSDYLLGRINQSGSDEIETIAAHHDGDDWTEEELKEIEEFKRFVLSKRKQTR